MGDTIKEIDYKKEYFNCLTHINMLKNQLQELQSNNGILDVTSTAEIDRLQKQLAEKDKENEVLRRALRNSVIDTDFYKYGSQSTTDEIIKRILRIEEQYIQQAKEQGEK